jgi:hypothetical protein
MTELMHVELLWLEKRIENWDPFCYAAEEQILDKRRRILSCSPGSLFAFVRWSSSDYGMVVSRIDIIRAVPAGQRFATVPFVRPGRDILLRLSGWPKVERVLQLIDAVVIDPGSLQVNRRGRRVKTDRVDVKMLLRTLIAWCRGERHVWSLVRIPSIDEEDLRRSHRERGRLVRERTAHINRIKGLLFGQGIRGINVKSQYKTLAVDNLVTGDGHRLPPRLASRSRSSWARSCPMY